MTREAFIKLYRGLNYFRGLSGGKTKVYDD
jgi:hypothetical protein